MKPRCAATHPERCHQCQLREGHNGPHRAWGGGREHSDDLTWTADPECRDCLALRAELQRTALLLERLAEDHFPDQQAFNAWINRQMMIALRRES